MRETQTHSFHAACEAVQELYAEVDVPPPSLTWPIAPLGPIMERLFIVTVELSALSRRAAQEYLLRCGALRAPLFADGTISLSGGVAGTDTPPIPSGDSAFLTETLSGFAFQADDLAYLFVNADEPVVRRRFSMAHELGHYYRHFRPALRAAAAQHASLSPVTPGVVWDAFGEKEGSEFETIKANRTAEDEALPAPEQQEREADDFAAALLMPPLLVTALRGRLAPAFTGDEAGLSERLAMELLVSGEAMNVTLNLMAVDAGRSDTAKAQGGELSI